MAPRTFQPIRNIWLVSFIPPGAPVSSRTYIGPLNFAAAECSQFVAPVALHDTGAARTARRIASDARWQGTSARERLSRKNTRRETAGAKASPPEHHPRQRDCLRRRANC